MESSPNHKVAVRPATTDDIEFMVHLFLDLARQRKPDGTGVDVGAIVQGTRETTLEQVRGKIPNSITYVIDFDGQRAGRLRVVRTVEHIEIAGIQVLPPFQRRGIGTEVITALLQEGMKKGLPVVLQVDKDNSGAERLYRRLGFRRCGETHDTHRMTTGDASQG